MRRWWEDDSDFRAFRIRAENAGRTLAEQQMVEDAAEAVDQAVWRAEQAELDRQAATGWTSDTREDRLLEYRGVQW